MNRYPPEVWAVRFIGGTLHGVVRDFVREPEPTFLVQHRTHLLDLSNLSDDAEYFTPPLVDLYKLQERRDADGVSSWVYAFVGVLNEKRELIK